MFRPGTSIIFLALCLVAQILAWRLCLRRSGNRHYRLAVHAVFLAFNLAYVAAILLIPRGGMNGALWTFVGRPAISWQVVHLLAVLPAGGISWILFLAGRALFRAARWALRSGSAAAGSSGLEPSPAFQAAWEAGGGQVPSGAGGPTGPGRAEATGLSRAAAGAAGPGEGVTGAAGPGESALGSRDSGDPAFRQSRRDFVRAAGSAGIIGILSLAGYGVFRQSTAPVAKRVTLRYPDLPRELHGFRIAHLSDFHLGLWSSPREMGLAIERAGLERPDMVILTGDMVDLDAEYAREYGRPVERHLSRVPHGVWAVLGNHDHHYDPWRIASLLGASGIRVLREERASPAGLPLSITGLDDQGLRGSWLRRRQLVDEDGMGILDFGRVTGPPERPGDFRILLNHRPEGFRQAAAEGGFALYLAGHTHGGQYSVPWEPRSNVGALVWKYTSGLYSSWGAHLNVSCGLASVGVPFRFGPWPEFTVITLERGAPQEA
ncbi:MAG: metallophosphoesterase [Deltaproteobacteria bacterium]|nr:metallophosphoesterase [Deltaproteobacteria bacterium]